MDRPKQIIKYISDSIANLSSLVYNTSSSHVDEDEVRTTRIPLSISGDDTLKALDESLEWTRDDEGNETIVMKVSDYEEIQQELSLQKTRLEEQKAKEREYKKMLGDYDRTLAYVLERKERGNASLVMEEGGRDGPAAVNDEVCRLRQSEQRLKSYIQALRKDLFTSTERSEAFKELAKQEIESLKAVCDEERRKVVVLSSKIVKLEKAFETRCEESIELIEYCKYLLRG
jgi:hypothetical protein